MISGRLFNFFFNLWILSISSCVSVKDPVDKTQLSLNPGFFHDSSPRWPLETRSINSAYGPRKGGFHHGIDLKANYGDRIFAVQGGVVRFAGVQRGFGKLVIIVHDDGFEATYAHCSKLKVHKGQRVRGGQTIAYVGSSGRSTGAHLHFELRRGPSLQSFDPMVLYSQNQKLLQKP